MGFYMSQLLHHNNEYMEKGDLMMVFQTAKNFGANGIIMWGSSHDVKSR